MRKVLLGSLALLTGMGCDVFNPPETQGHSTGAMKTDGLPESDNIDDRRNEPPLGAPGSLEDQAGFNDIDKLPGGSQSGSPPNDGENGPSGQQDPGGNGPSGPGGNGPGGQEGPSGAPQGETGGSGNLADNGGPSSGGQNGDTSGGGRGYGGYGGNAQGEYGEEVDMVDYGGGYGGGYGYGYGGGGYGGGGSGYDAFKHAQHDISPAALKRRLF